MLSAIALHLYGVISIHFLTLALGFQLKTVLKYFKFEVRMAVLQRSFKPRLRNYNYLVSFGNFLPQEIPIRMCIVYR
jgi:hypothetical protein